MAFVQPAPDSHSEDASGLTFLGDGRHQGLRQDSEHVFPRWL